MTAQRLKAILVSKGYTPNKHNIWGAPGQAPNNVLAKETIVLTRSTFVVDEVDGISIIIIEPSKNLVIRREYRERWGRISSDTFSLSTIKEEKNQYLYIDYAGEKNYLFLS